MNVNNKLKRNISVSYIYNFLLQLNITSAIWVLYLAFRGMSLTQIGLLESVYHITGVLFELPTGVIFNTLFFFGSKSANYCIFL